MYGIIDNYNFKEMEAQKYYAPPASWSDEKKKETARNRIFSGEFLGSEKKDGYFCRIIKDEDGAILLQSRSRGVNGEFPEKHEWVPHLQPFFDSLPNGTCLLGELYLPSSPGSSNITKILGCLKDKAIARQEKEKLHLYLFDVLAYDNQSFMEVDFEHRIDTLDILRFYYKDDYPEVEFAIYTEGDFLWKHLQDILVNGGEGVVITRKTALYQPGKRPSKDCLKIKKELKETIDCFFTGAFAPPTKEYSGKNILEWDFWQNVRTGEKIQGQLCKEFDAGAPIIPVTKPYFYGWAGSLEIGCVKGDKVVPIGYLSGLTDEIKSNAAAYKGKVIEITAMELLPTGGIRHPKFLQFRPDKNWKDCKYEDIFGE